MTISNEKATPLDYTFLFSCFDKSMKDVLGTMAGFEIREIKEAQKDNKTYKAEITGAMLLQGNRNAMLTISMSLEVSKTIATYMTGILPEDLEDEDLYDCVAELVNLVAGRTKAQLTQTDYHFQLSPPFTLVGKDHYIVYKNKVNKIYIKYGATNFELHLEIFYT